MAKVFSDIAKGIRFSLDAHAYGRADRLDIEVGLKSGKGNVNAGLLVENLIAGKGPLKFSGMASTDDLDLKSIMDKIPVGPVTMRTDVHATALPI